MRGVPFALVLVASCNQLLGNGTHFTTGGDGGGDGPVDVDPCVAQGLPPTTISGTVFAPNGTLPLYDAAVYIPTQSLSAIVAGVSPPTCVSGAPPIVARSRTDGTFTLDHVAVTDTMLVIQVGKWRRQVPLSGLHACTDNPLDASSTRLPQTASEGEIPQFAVATGAADGIECMLRDIGLPDNEFVAGSGTSGHVHLFAATGTQSGVGVLGGATLPGVAQMISSLSSYDIALFGCEGQPAADATGSAASELYTWTGSGGWAFLTHYNYAWLQMGPSSWPTLGTFMSGGSNMAVTTVSIDTSTPIGSDQAAWMVAIGASTTAGQFSLANDSGRNSCTTIDSTLTVRRMYLDPTLNGNVMGVQSFTWAAATNGGRVTFDDVHVTGSDGSAGEAFPSECTNTAVTAQEKALVFQLFETPTCE